MTNVYVVSSRWDSADEHDEKIVKIFSRKEDAETFRTMLQDIVHEYSKDYNPYDAVELAEHRAIETKWTDATKGEAVSICDESDMSVDVIEWELD